MTEVIFISVGKKNNFMKDNKKQIKYIIGNAQTIGSMENQSNYFAVFSEPNLVAVMADGGIDHVNGRKAAVIGVENMAGVFTEKILNKNHFDEVVNKAVLNIRQNVKDYIYRGRMPGLSLSVLCVSDGTAYFYSVGDISIFVYDYRNIRNIHGISFNNIYEIKSAENFMMASRGVCSALTQVEMLQFLQEEKSGKKARGSFEERAYNKSVKIIEEINRKNIKDAENATVVLLEGLL